MENSLVTVDNGLIVQFLQRALSCVVTFRGPGQIHASCQFIRYSYLKRFPFFGREIKINI